MGAATVVDGRFHILASQNTIAPTTIKPAQKVSGFDIPPSFSKIPDDKKAATGDHPKLARCEGHDQRLSCPTGCGPATRPK
jgi:hypothetical protein